MAIALELLIIPALLVLGVILFSLIADFSILTLVISAIVIVALFGAVIGLLRLERSLEGEREEHEEHIEAEAEEDEEAGEAAGAEGVEPGLPLGTAGERDEGATERAPP